MNLQTVRHSLAHIMAASVKNLYPEVKFGIGPAIENGFYYDFDLPESLTPDDLLKIEGVMKKLIKEDITFEKKIILKEEATEIFKNQIYKLELIKELAKKNISIYKSSDFIDLCAGPHVKSAKEINPDTFKLTKIAGAYWRGTERNPMLTRIYGIYFQTKKELNDYLKKEVEAEKRGPSFIGSKIRIV